MSKYDEEEIINTVNRYKLISKTNLKKILKVNKSGQFEKRLKKLTEEKRIKKYKNYKQKDRILYSPYNIEIGQLNHMHHIQNVAYYLETQKGYEIEPEKYLSDHRYNNARCDLYAINQNQELYIEVEASRKDYANVNIKLSQYDQLGLLNKLIIVFVKEQYRKEFANNIFVGYKAQVLENLRLIDEFNTH